MRTVLNQTPEVVRSWLERRRALDQDRFDEVWEGSYHVAPAAHPSHGYVDAQIASILASHVGAAGLVHAGPVNVGSPADYRVPDRVLTRGRASTTFVPTVALVVEILSPGDESWAKLDFYFAHDVEEVWIIDPRHQEVQLLIGGDEAYVRRTDSSLLDLSDRDIQAAIDWPPLS